MHFNPKHTQLKLKWPFILLYNFASTGFLLTFKILGTLEMHIQYN